MLLANYVPKCQMSSGPYGPIFKQEIMQKADQNENLEMDFAEFVQYMTEHEQKLRLAFSHLDRNKDGKLLNCRKIYLDLSVDMSRQKSLKAK